jgi:hypothetical protein
MIDDKQMAVRQRCQRKELSRNLESSELKLQY